jgi:ABC-type phosphate transport system permease subunit
MRPSTNKGEPKVWLTALGLTCCLLMIIGLLYVITINGISSFLPKAIEVIEYKKNDQVEVCSAVHIKDTFKKQLKGASIVEEQFHIGNKDLYPASYIYINKQNIISRKIANGIMRIERLQNGDAFIYPSYLQSTNGDIINIESKSFFSSLNEWTKVNSKHLRSDVASTSFLIGKTAQGEELKIPSNQILHYYFPNEVNFLEKCQIFLYKIYHFIMDDPRESNTEGGIFPAIYGTFIMTLLMALMVTPLGVIAAIYLKEYAKQGLFIKIIRICVNNLAGVPSIVFGVFGVGFFIYGTGSFIDGGPTNPKTPSTWLTLATFLLVSIGFNIFLYFKNNNKTIVHSKITWSKRLENALYLLNIISLIFLISCCPYFHGFYSDSLPSPTFGTGGILWASLTLSIMTLPVVIVATEEAISAVPRGVREAALASGASKWQQVVRIVLPASLPGIMTGVILAMARGAGEVAPLMITGVVKLAPSLPFDTQYPFIHAERKFMHLGFHIYDLGFQSPDSESAKPMVYATTLLLIFLVVTLNIVAITLRNKIRKKLQATAF